jgi:hypothetical protein
MDYWLAKSWDSTWSKGQYLHNQSHDMEESGRSQIVIRVNLYQASFLSAVDSGEPKIYQPIKIWMVENNN